jgi:hypothetical protein
MNRLVHLIAWNWSRLRITWRTFWVYPEMVTERLVQSDGKLTRNSQSARDDDARNSITPQNRMIDGPERQVDDVFVNPPRHNPVGKHGGRNEGINDFRLLFGKYPLLMTYWKTPIQLEHWRLSYVTPAPWFVNYIIAILSSEISLFNGLHEDFPRKNFPRPSPLEKGKRSLWSVGRRGLVMGQA